MKMFSCRGFIVWVAQGFGSGRVPVAPGTFGSLAGILWTIVLLRTGQIQYYCLGMGLSFVASVWFCGEAEKIMKQTDPSSVVLDEIVAMPLCYLGPIAWYMNSGHLMPGVDFYWSSSTWPLGVAGFVLFRFFDVAKPWPIGPSQKLPGGWGVTIDDLLAGVCTTAVLTGLYLWRWH